MNNLEEIIKLYLESRADLTENEKDVILSLLDIYSDMLEFTRADYKLADKAPRPEHWADALAMAGLSPAYSLDIPSNKNTIPSDEQNYDQVKAKEHQAWLTKLGVKRWEKVE